MPSHAPTQPAPAILVLEDGRTFHGEAFGAEGETFGEAVFNTGMTGYQETLTDPSYHRQVVVMTAPHVGNTGVNDEDPESRQIWVAGYVVRDPSRVSSSWRARRSLDDELRDQGVVGISGVDTRALTRHLRERGAMRVGISSTTTDADALLARVKESGEMAGYYVAGKKLPSWVIAFSSNTTGESAWLILGLTGMGYLVGAHAFWVILGEVLGVTLAWVLVARPFKEYTDRYDSITVPDYLEDRFHDSAHVLRIVSAIIIFVYTLGSYEVAWLLGRTTPEPLSVLSFRMFGSIELLDRPAAAPAAVTGSALALGLTLVAVAAGARLGRTLGAPS